MPCCMFVSRFRCAVVGVYTSTDDKQVNVQGLYRRVDGRTSGGGHMGGELY